MSECPICLEKICGNVHVTRCGHKFHNHCSEQLKSSGHSKCPVCRRVIFNNKDDMTNKSISRYRDFEIQINGMSVGDYIRMMASSRDDEDLENARTTAESVFNSVFE